MWNNSRVMCNPLQRIALCVAIGAFVLHPLVSVAAVTPRQVTKLTVVEYSQESAKIRWQHQQGIKKYALRLMDADGVVLRTLDAKKRLKTITDLTADTTYGVQVRAVKGSKKGPWSSVLSFTTKADVTDDEQQELYEKYSAVNGTYSGGWNNLTFSTTGDTTAVVDVQPDGTASFTLDLGGMVFGEFDPAPATYTSTYDAEGIVFTTTGDPVFGTLTITVVVNDDGTATITLDSQYVPTGGIETVTATGTLTQDVFEMNYTIGFILGASADGTFTLEKQ